MPIQKTSEGLRSTLFDTLERFLSGEIDAAHAKTVAKLCDSISKSAVVDIEHKKLVLEQSRRVINGASAEVADLGLNLMLVSNQNNPKTKP